MQSVKQQFGLRAKPWLFIFIPVVVLALFFGVLDILPGHALPDDGSVKSGVVGECLDLTHNNSLPGSEVQLWACNNSKAQSWQTDGLKIKHEDMCLAVSGNKSYSNAPVVVDECSDAASQVWLYADKGLRNPNSGMCLTAPGGEPGQQLLITSCQLPQKKTQQWYFADTNLTNASGSNCQKYNHGDRIACIAEREWSVWQSGGIKHQDLLSKYTDNAPYEQWCADFISYVYKQAGYTFKNDDGSWKVSLATAIQNQNFTYHDAKGYVPKTGDVAYFSYTDGHVEIVVSGGATPTFIYGNAAAIDPTTGNGEMAANTITHNSKKGEVLYYLSPNFN